jgi:hypothetical protein
MLITWHLICAGFLSKTLLVLCTFISPYGRLPPLFPFREEDEAEVCKGTGPSDAGVLEGAEDFLPAGLCGGGVGVVEDCWSIR